MRETIGILGWIIGIQGALGLLGRLVAGEDWGLIHIWIDPHPFLYVAMIAAGVLLARGSAQSSRS